MNLKDKDLTIYVGSKIKEYRKKRKMTQKELAKLINKSDNTISNYETGAIAPSQEALFALARILEVKVDDFFPGTTTDGYLDQAVSNTDNEMDIADISFLNQLVNHAKTLNDVDRKRLIDNIRLAVEFFDKTEK
ncbi:helix-turn-helix domain-containing protein (plasmid) [Lysinibacillus capsici]|uniref:helix-turn-helix transcriptional regulator n=1 Tax=Lysinibacillus capsici TaxID=2115968 RepID=UPI0021D93FAA|nr:helix-turn-helix transcriptional regulator [Lysinibacillus capsici]UYB50139.1 helix-turn-helix domain-containing protein [Lysinibacillus capsici]UYB50213.1 helix-turn-helix domain-containing protein [Lysinibacillus capsici]